MIPIFLDQLSPFSIAAEGERDQIPLPLFPERNERTTFPYIFSYNNTSLSQSHEAAVRTEDQQHDHYLQQLPQSHQPKIESSDESFTMNAMSHQNPPFETKAENDHGRNARVLLGDQRRRMEEQHQSAKWMSSKMRFMKKMMSSTQQGNVIKIKRRRSTQPQADQLQLNQESSSGSSTNTATNVNNPTGVIRVCSDCNTTKTPLWRSGPQGPKSLCNACGIRQRKARRAMAAAAAASAGLAPTETVDNIKAQKEKKAADHMDRTLPFKKRCKITAATATTANSQNKHRLDDFTIRLSKSSAFHQQVFPEDERDAAILLMTLSCGLIHG